MTMRRLLALIWVTACLDACLDAQVTTINGVTDLMSAGPATINANFTNLNAAIAAATAALALKAPIDSPVFTTKLTVGVTPSATSIDPVTGITDPTALLLPKFRLAMARTLDGVSDTKILVPGDSTADGVGGSTMATVTAFSSWPWRVSTLLNSRIPSAPGLAKVPSAFDGTAHDTRWVLGTGWSILSGYGWGSSGLATGTAPAGTLVFQHVSTEPIYDTYDVWYTLGAGNGTIHVTATGGATSDIPTVAGSQSVNKVTVVAGSASATNAITISATGGAVFISGVDSYLSTTRRVRVSNAGVPGSTSTQWALDVGVTGLPHIRAYAPDLTVLPIGINDARDSVSPATLQANLAAIIVAAQLSGDAVLMTMPPSSGAPYTTFEPQYQAVYKALSVTYNVPIIDIYGRFGGTWQTAFMFDALHPNNAGYWDIAGEVARKLMQGVGLGVPTVTSPIGTVSANRIATFADATGLTIQDAAQHSMGLGYLSGTKTAGTTGTTANTLCKIDATGNVVTAGAADVGILGVCVSTQTTGQAVEVATRGIINCIADNATTIGDVAIVGTGTGGDCRDAGVTNTTQVSVSKQVIGKVLTAVAGGALASIQLYGPGHYGAQVLSTDVPTLNQSTTGNAATATALAALPAACSAGNYPLGILANGNATGCTAAGGSATTHAQGDNTTATATDAFVQNQLCSIAQFNPTGDGATDDSAVFTAAAATCPTIFLTPGKNYAIGVNLTLASAIFALASPAGGSLTVKTGVTLTLNGTVLAPLAQVFVLQGTGAVAIGPNTSNVYVEWFGAKGDNTADDTAAIQNTINAVSNGTVRFAAKTYKTSSVLTITHSYENLIGSGFGVNIAGPGAGVGGTIISNTATTGDVIKLNGGGTGNCGTGGIFSNRIEFLHIIRVTAATAGTGVNTTNGCFVQINNVTSEDSLSNFYLAGSGNTLLQNDVAFYNTTTGSIAGIGFNVDCTSAANASTRIKYGSVIGRGITGITGLSAHGILADLFVDDFETAVVATGVNIAAVSCVGPACAEDIHLNHLVLDVNAVAGVTVSGITNGASGNRPSALIHDAYINTNGSGGIGVDIESSAGVAVTDSVIQSTGAGGIGVKIAGGSNNTVSGTKFDQTPIGISVTSTNNVITGNILVGSAASPTTTHIVLGANANINMVTVNQLGGTATNGITLSSTSLGNIAYPNIIDPTAITNAIVSAGGKGNVVNGPGYSTPTVGTCGTIGANSVNDAGFITSTVTGSCVSVLTFDVNRMGAAGIGWSCSMANSTTPANLIQQTGSTTTSATFTGTTVMGDVLRYKCTGY
jgi:lysophospholipase L1-like esterase